jgi:magnesium chelatase family protein
VLLLDELPEFPRSVLEALRQPLEDGVVSVARVGGRALFPASFRLVATMNLCPCGGRGDPRIECTCTAARVATYRDKVSRALLDRFDLVVAMPRPRADELAASPSEPSAAVRVRVVEAAARLQRETPRRRPAASELLDRAVDRLPLSGRGRARVARVARTIAALAGSAEVLPEHVAEALSYRSPAELSSP